MSYEFMLLAVINSQKLEQQYAVIASFGTAVASSMGVQDSMERKAPSAAACCIFSPSLGPRPMHHAACQLMLPWHPV